MSLMRLGIEGKSLNRLDFLMIFLIFLFLYILQVKTSIVQKKECIVKILKGNVVRFIPSGIINNNSMQG